MSRAGHAFVVGTGHYARRDANAELQGQLVRDPLAALRQKSTNGNPNHCDLK
jgi:hypothetical protein